MPAQKRIERLQKLTERLKEASSFVLLNYQGLTHRQLATLRAKLKKVGSVLMVTKNTLLERAIKDSSYSLPSPLSGPTATLFIGGDPIAPLKALKEFQDEFSLPKIKIGILEGRFAEKEKILKLAHLGSKEALVTQLVLGLKSPSQRLIFSLKGNLQKLIFILKSRSLN